MGKVSDYIIEQIGKQADQHGIITWYDPEENYRELVETLMIPGVTVLRFKDSMFRLRHEIEPFLEFIAEDGKPSPHCEKPPRLLVYVPKDRQETGHALAEIESAGTVMEPGASPWQKNTRLKVIADQVFKKILPDRAADICRKVDDGILELKDLDLLAAEPDGPNVSTIKLIFGTTSAETVALGFAAANNFDEDIIAKKALGELSDLFHIEMGISLDKEKDLKTLKRSFWRALFTTELVRAFPADKQPSQLSALPIPNLPYQIKKVIRVCQTWRQRLDYIPAYKEAANKIQQELGLANLDLPVDIITGLETFSTLENLLLGQAEQLLLEEKADEALNLARKRLNMFWASHEPVFRLHWKLVETGAQLTLLGSKINNAIKSQKLSPQQCVEYYTASQDPWCNLDTFYRHLESRYSNFEPGLAGEHHRLEKVISCARKTYHNTVHLLMEVFTAAFSETDFKIKGILSQTEIFAKFVSPPLNENHKTAYFLVDGLRYEMGRELAAGLAEHFSAAISPGISLVPSVTITGMAGLLPGAERGLQLVETGSGKITPTLGTASLKDRTSRLKYLASQLEKPIASCKINELLKPGRKLKEEIEKAGLIVVTSQEIDRWGEDADDETEVRVYMDEVLDKLGKGLRRLASLGVTRFIITADHGHLLVESIESGMRMDPPGGESQELHRSFWIGKGGKDGPGYIRTPLSRLGYDSDLEIAFPRTLSCFVAKGSLSYMHGGVSLQEMVIPVVRLETKKTPPLPVREMKVKISLSSPRITTRLFSIYLDYTPAGLYAPAETRVKTTIKSGNQEVGTATMAAYGFEEGTREILLKKGKINNIAFRLAETAGIEYVSVHVLDAVSQVELARIEKIPVNISI